MTRVESGRERVQILHPDAPISSWFYPAPATDSAPTLVWAHGGAFAGGDVDMVEGDGVAQGLSRRGVNVLSVDYRLVSRPNYVVFRKNRQRGGVRYPTPMNDVTSALDLCATLGIDAHRISIGGASAGASLVAAAVARGVAGGSGLPVAVVLAYPTVHRELPAQSEQLKGRVKGLKPWERLTPRTVEIMNRNYAGSPIAFEDADAFAGGRHLPGFPPTLILNADRDDLRASGEAFARELEAVGTTVETHTMEDTKHGFLNDASDPAFEQGLDIIAAWIQVAPTTSTETTRP